jgi:hypothetical protein
MIKKVASQRCRRLTDDHPIHPIRAGTKCAAQPSGAELESPGERIHEFGKCAGVSRFRCVQKITDVLPGLLIRILC